jgi:putative Mg2+ transporter-C (MgtC) family protein
MISDVEIAARLALAALLGSLIGFERERLLWAAGIRTHMLVCVGACLLMIVSAFGFQQPLTMAHVILDPSRVAAQVVSGIGFLGAGSILLRGNVVRGLTTAASIWAVAAIGLAVGGGLFFAGIVSTAIILTILAGVKPIEEAYRARAQSCTIDITTEHNPLGVDQLKKLLGVRASQLRRVMVLETNGDDTRKLKVQLARVSNEDIRTGVARLRREPGIQSVEVAERRRRHQTAAD